MIVQTIVGAVLLIAAPCPGVSEEGCVQLSEPTPIVYVAPIASPIRHRWVFMHELGHIAASRTPGAPAAIGPANELYAERFAACHVPWSRPWMRYRAKHGWLAAWNDHVSRMQRYCALWLR